MVMAGLLAAVAAGLSGTIGRAQDAQPSDSAPSGGPFRTIAPGIEYTIPPETQQAESYSHHDIIGLLERDPQYGERDWSENLAKGLRLEHKIWALEFTFKPMRMIWVDVPNARGKFDRKLIWYLLYHVKNNGPDPVKFIPRMLLHSIDTDKIYADRLIPVAMKPIQMREDPNRKLLDSVEITEQDIAPSTEDQDNSVWGVATWEDIDPTTDEFHVYIQGLTNAYQRKIVVDEEGRNQWVFLRKTLQLHFWRPGDEFDENDAEVRYGVPNKLGYHWVYK